MISKTPEHFHGKFRKPPQDNLRQAAPAPQPAHPAPAADVPHVQNTRPDPGPRSTVQPYTESHFFTNLAQPVASASKHATSARERFLSPPRSSTIAAPAADNDSFEVRQELLREDPSTDFGDDLELDDDVLEQIDLAEKVALQDKGKGKGKAKADMYTSMQSEPSSSSGSRTTASGSGKMSTIATGSTRSSKLKDTPAREVIAIDEEDDFDSMYCSLDEADFLDDFEKEKMVPVRRKGDLPPESEIILISDSE